MIQLQQIYVWVHVSRVNKRYLIELWSISFLLLQITGTEIIIIILIRKRAPHDTSYHKSLLITTTLAVTMSFIILSSIISPTYVIHPHILSPTPPHSNSKSIELQEISLSHPTLSLHWSWQHTHMPNINSSNTLPFTVTPIIHHICTSGLFTLIPGVIICCNTLHLLQDLESASPCPLLQHQLCSHAGTCSLMMITHNYTFFSVCALTQSEQVQNTHPIPIIVQSISFSIWPAWSPICKVSLD